MSSLTDTLRRPSKATADLKVFLKEAFPTPRLQLSQTIVSPYTGRSASLIGKAFDYLLRFELQRNYPNITHARRWVAESAMRQFNTTEPSIWIDEDEEDLPGEELMKLLRERQEHMRQDVEPVARKFSKCQQVHQRFIEGKHVPIQTLLDVCLFLGQLDDMVRIGPRARMFIDAGPPDALNLADLKLLKKNLDLSIFNAGKQCILNPTFGAPFVGADADLVIDKTLIDVKTVKAAKVDRATLNQIICYYLLYLHGGINGHKKVKLDSIGVYFSRYNFLWKQPIKGLGSEKDFAHALRLLKRACK